ncbi:MAG: hypothetical protein OYL92_05755 [Acidobacteriota bacterium]|nr:hypothetical protein [Acidobacteriota bacterium]MDE3264463.1 hypothetical protein [Acidobacteriota bacterium]
MRAVGATRRALAAPVLLASALLAAAGTLEPAFAQPGNAQQEAETQIRHAFTLQHQRADDALEWMQSEMSAQGTIELQRATNTLVLRDRSSVLEHLLALLRDFDHPRRQIEFEIFILEASRRGSGDPRSELPAQLTDELGNWLAFTSYRLLGEGQFEATEGENVRYELGTEFRLSFRVGTVLLDRRLKLYGVEIERSRSAVLDERVFNGHLNVWVGKPLVLALPYRGSDASGLVVAVTVRSPREDGLGAGD